jgi:hypothetical protein
VAPLSKGKKGLILFSRSLMKGLSVAVPAFTLLLVGLPGAMIGQEIASLRVGDPIRVSVDSPLIQRVEGRVASLSPHTIVVREWGSTRSIGFSAITSLEVKRRTGRGFMKSVAFGLLGGAVGGALFGLAAGGGNSTEGFNALGRGFIGAIYGGAAGAAAGALHGACCGYSWRPVPLP